VLTPDEQAALRRTPTGRVADERWTRADLALLDEAEWVTGGAPRSFAHVVVDEAQDYSAMDLRLLARRTPARSMTILGDLAQATAAGTQRDWHAALATLDAPHGRIAELELGYRVPAPLLDFANRLLPVAAPRVRASRSVRRAGDPPVVVPCVTADDVAPAIVERLLDAEEQGSVGIVAPDAVLDRVAGALGEAAVSFVDARTALALGDGIALVPPEMVKGLEFDAVVVAEPAAIARLGEHGLRLLFIALTRAVRSLTVVHAEPLPAELRVAAHA
jgi:DNA helicase IV